MRGHIARKRGRYYVVVDVGADPETGKRRQKWHGGHRTRKEADAALGRIVNELHQGTYVEPTKQSLSQFLEEWLPAIRTTVRPSTWESYRSNMVHHVKPAIGTVALRRLSPGHLNELYADLLASGRKDGSGLAPRTVRYIHTILHRALRDAVRWGRLTRNPADLANPPKQERPEMKIWNADEVRRFLEGVLDERLYACYLLAATSGMRRGELLGLRWGDVDLSSGRLQVRQTLVVTNYRAHFSTPKTPRSRRSIALDPATVAGLKAHRARQLEDRLAWGELYDDSGLVFRRENGQPIHPQSLSDAFERHARRAGLPVIRFHDLRHTYATVALSAGVHPKVVSERLGHASIAITLDTYSHVIESVGEEAANTVAALILGGGQGS